MLFPAETIFQRISAASSGRKSLRCAPPAPTPISVIFVPPYVQLTEKGAGRMGEHLFLKDLLSA